MSIHTASICLGPICQSLRIFMHHSVWRQHILSFQQGFYQMLSRRCQLLNFWHAWISRKSDIARARVIKVHIRTGVSQRGFQVHLPTNSMALQPKKIFKASWWSMAGQVLSLGRAARLHAFLPIMQQVFSKKKISCSTAVGEPTTVEKRFAKFTSQAFHYKALGLECVDSYLRLHGQAATVLSAWN